MLLVHKKRNRTYSRAQILHVEADRAGVDREGLDRLIYTETRGRTVSANDLSSLEITAIETKLHGRHGLHGRTYLDTSTLPRLDDSDKRSPLPAQWAAKVVGVSFTPGYPGNLVHLADAWSEPRGDEGLAAILVREDHNPYDANAVGVSVPAVEALSPGSGHVGYLSHDVAARLAPLLDAGEIWQAEVAEVRIDPDYPDRPGLLLAVHHVPTAPEG